MKFNIEAKIFPDFSSFESMLKQWKADKETIVFTNGCFDIIHHGHIDSLLKSAEMGTKLVVGLNSDNSVTLLKGRNRPVFDVKARAIMLAAMGFVDAVVTFSEETPSELIAQIIPDILVKGKEYAIHEIAGHETVLRHGGKVETLDLVPDISTSLVISRIKLLD
jgi:D-beta-D-heptose 7-phosphate kinase/D-beta-D-heptose 1-phosphate adenosyltransferase